MAIVNRDLDPSQQRLNVVVSTAVIGVSQLVQLAIAPCAVQILNVSSSALGLSGSPIVGLQIQRFVVGSGLTTIPINGSSLLTITALGTSGIQSQVLPASGSTLTSILRGDVLQAVTSTANTAASYCFESVLQVLQDVKQDFGS